MRGSINHWEARAQGCSSRQPPPRSEYENKTNMAAQAIYPQEGFVYTCSSEPRTPANPRASHVARFESFFDHRRNHRLWSPLCCFPQFKVQLPFLTIWYGVISQALIATTSWAWVNVVYYDRSERSPGAYILFFLGMASGTVLGGLGLIRAMWLGKLWWDVSVVRKRIRAEPNSRHYSDGELRNLAEPLMARWFCQFRPNQ